ncbi:MAG: SH3 domain-containing protein [Sebaldella sp.]|nr:SH3 domain-containing protein [Sebaldella sp.]
MKKKLLIIFMLLSVMLFSDVLKLPNQYNKAAVNLSGWSLNEKDLDLNQDALDDILLIHYKVESTNVVTYYTSYINQGNGTYKKELQIEKIFSSDTFANDFSAFTKDFVSNYFEYKSGKKTGTTVSNTVTPAKKETVKPADKPSTTAKPVTEVVKPVENVEPTTTDYNILESYSDKKPDNMTFNLKYDKNAPKNIDNFVFVKSDVKIRKEPNYQSPIVSTAKFTDKIKVLSKIDKKSVNSQYDWYEVQLADGTKGYVYADGVEKRAFEWNEMAVRIDKSNKFFEQSEKEKKDVYVVDQYVALSKDVNTPKDRFGNRENQSIRAYSAPGSKDYINIPDRSLLKILEESNGYIKVETLAYGGPFYISSSNKAKLKKSNITSEVKRFIIVDSESENEAVIEKTNGKWNVITYSFVTTGKDNGTSSYATPYGDFLIAYSKPVMVYTRSARADEKIDDSKKVAGRTDVVVDGEAAYAVRFSGGGYLHGIPAAYGPNRDARKAATAKKIGTYRESHKCVRHYDDQIKFIYDWLGNSTPGDKNGYRAPTEPTLVIVM